MVEWLHWGAQEALEPVNRQLPLLVSIISIFPWDVKTLATDRHHVIDPPVAESLQSIDSPFSLNYRRYPLIGLIKLLLGGP